MSFAIPRNVPRFNDSQRAYENKYWAHNQNGSGTGGTIGSFFENKELPMYKDKPYNYTASRRQKPWLRRTGPTVGALVVFVLLCLYLVWGPSKSTEERRSRLWNWVPSSDGSSPNWDSRRESVKRAFEVSWDGYAKYAWGKDEYFPLSKGGQQIAPNGLGWIIVDSLDTLMIMNLTTRLTNAREWLSTSLNFTQDMDVNAFEVTTRILGGLLSAHYLSTEFPEFAPIEDDDVGKPGEDLYIELATDLADRLLGAFDSKSRVPYAYVNLETRRGAPSRTDDGASLIAEAAGMQLEMKYIAVLLGEHVFWDAADKVAEAMDGQGVEGLLPAMVHPDSGIVKDPSIGAGNTAYTYYECLLKQFFQTSKQESVYKDMWKQALTGFRKYLLTRTASSHFSILGERPNGLDKSALPRMDHSACFAPGAIAIGATDGRRLSEARKSKFWSPKEEEEVQLARELMKTCWGMYKATATGLAADSTYFTIDHEFGTESITRHISASVNWKDKAQGWRSDLEIRDSDSHNRQRSEAIESLFYLWRLTEEPIYREWGWEMFLSFLNYTAANGDAGFVSLTDVNTLPPKQRDNMDGVWLSRTLKYFYLLFSPPDILPLDSVVFSVGAHSFPRFKLQRGLKTGWTRSLRDKGAFNKAKG